MFKYVGDISELSHYILKEYCSKFDVAVDGTLGNGKDTEFLTSNFKKVFSFDVQSICIENYKLNHTITDNLILINDSHEEIKKYVHTNIDAAIYNLGFLPGGDKTITTHEESTIKAIENTLDILSPGGIITIASYLGHREGKNEYLALEKFFKGLNKKDFGVMEHRFLNRSEVAPRLIVIEKQ